MYQIAVKKRKNILFDVLDGLTIFEISCVVDGNEVKGDITLDFTPTKIFSKGKTVNEILF